MATKENGFIKTTLMVVGIIALVIILLIVGAIIALILIKPYGLDITQIPALISGQGSTESTYDHPLLSSEQESLLQSMGVDVESLPTQIPPEVESCAVEALGQERVDQLKAGATPGVTDYLKAKQCIE